MKKINLIQGSAEWKAFRREKIGASDCPAIMGCGYVTPNQLWGQKVLGEEQYVTQSMTRGSELESVVRDLLNREVERPFESAVYESEEYPWMIASLDGIDEYGGLIEIKCPNDEIFKDFQAYGTVPNAWLWQVQHQMCVMNAKSVRIFAYNGVILASNLVERDETAIKELIAKEKDFYKCMCELTPPKEPLPVRDDERALELFGMIEEAKTQIEHWKTRLEELKEGAVELSNGEEYECAGYKVQYIVKPGTVNYKAIPQLKGINLNAYRGKPIEYWAIS